MEFIWDKLMGCPIGLKYVISAFVVSVLFFWIRHPASDPAKKNENTPPPILTQGSESKIPSEGGNKQVSSNIQVGGDVAGNSAPVAMGANATAVQTNNYGWSVEDVMMFLENERKNGNEIDYDERYPAGYAIFGRNDRDRSVGPIKETKGVYYVQWINTGFEISEDRKTIELWVSLSRSGAKPFEFGVNLIDRGNITFSNTMPLEKGRILHIGRTEMPEGCTNIFVEILDTEKPILVIGSVSDDNY